MKKTTKKTTNNSKKKLFKVVAIALVVIALVPVAISVINNLQTRQAQIDRLEMAATDLQKLHTDLVTSLRADTNTATFKKVCYESSAKLSRGTITCGSSGQFVVADNMPYDTQKQNFITLLNKTGSFTYKSTEDIRDDKTGLTIGFVVHFAHTKTATLCDVILESKNYTISCLEIVPDFLPGYDKEQ